MSKQQKRLLLFLAEAPSKAWSRGSVRRHLYGERMTRAQSASFSRMIARLEKRGYIIVTPGVLMGCGSDGARIGLTASGCSIVNRLEVRL